MSDSTHDSNKKIAKNTAMLYIRMLVIMAVSLYTSRVILKALGFVDMGIYNVVGSIVIFLGFINNSMSIAVQRFLTYDMGKNDTKALHNTFNTSILIHILIACIIFVLAEIFGFFMLENVLNIPPDRLYAAKFVFQMSIITCCIGIVRVPYNALIIAYERMGVFAYLSILEAAISLAIAFILVNADIDRLKLYAMLMMLSMLIVSIAYVLYCRIQFKEIKFKFKWDKVTFKRLLGFASWSALGELAWGFTLQGVNFVLNIFFGPLVNTARGISYQVQSIVMRFVSGFQTAVNPQITKRYAAGEKESLYSLVFRTTSFSYYLVLVLSLPLMLNIDYVLTLWLGDFPEYTKIFCILILANCLVDIISNLLASVAKAYGRIRNYQLTVSFTLAMNLPLSYIALKFGLPAYSTFIVYAFVSFALLFARLYLLKRMMDFPVKSFITEVVLPLIYITMLVLPLPLATKYLMDGNGLVDFITTSAAAVISVMTVIYLIGLKNEEKNIIHNIIKKILRKV